MTWRIAAATLFFCSLLFVPQSLLGFNGLYTTKLRVAVEMGPEYWMGVLFAAMFVALFFACAAIAGLSRATLRRNILILAQRRSFRVAMVVLTAIMFAFLAVGIGVKQSGSGANFLIRLLPRELLLIIVTIFAVATRRPFWVMMVLAHVLYWVAIGSKASLFLVALSLLYYLALERVRIRPVHLGWAAVLAVLLPISFLVPIALRLGIPVGQFFSSLYTSPDLAALFASRSLGRISWFDGMLLTRGDLEPLGDYAVMHNFEVALASFVPGLTTTLVPFGQRVIYLFQAANLENFAGAIGLPGLLKAMAYNGGPIGLGGTLLIIGAVLIIVMRMTASRNPILSMLGFSALISLMLTLIISGNLDSTMGRVIPPILSGLFFFWGSRLMFRGLGKGPRTRPDPAWATTGTGTETGTARGTARGTAGRIPAQSA